MVTLLSLRTFTRPDIHICARIRVPLSKSKYIRAQNHFAYINVTVNMNCMLAKICVSIPMRPVFPFSFVLLTFKTNNIFI